MNLPNIDEQPTVKELVRRALEEDVGSGDATSIALVPQDRKTTADMIARIPCVVSGGSVAGMVFHSVDPGLSFEVLAPDGEHVEADTVICRITGNARSILTGERTALNFMQRMCGIASLTSEFVKRVEGTGARILDTRKTTPGMRMLEKYAVLCGGGVNHRMGLYDMVLMKDNHRKIWAETHKDGLGGAVRAAREAYPGLPVEVEVESEDDLVSVLKAGPDWILLDNMTPEMLKRCVEINAGKCNLEASGGITLDTVRSVAESGVNAISLGCLTHSAIAADLSLEFTDG